MQSIWQALRALLFVMAAGFATASGATAFTTNFSDLWWNPSKSGWGINITMQSNVMFATWFVYGPDNRPIWYSATLEYAGQSGNGALVFAGDLYVTSGPWFGGPFNPALVQYRNVGVASFSSQFTDRATLQYTVDGIAVVEAIQRQTLRNDDLTGNYMGGTSDVSFDCTNPANDNIRSEDAGPVTVTHTGTDVLIRTPSCTIAGTYSQQGQAGTVLGTYSCTGGTAGTLTLFDARVETSGITGRYVARNQDCSLDGNLGGTRRK